MPARPHLSPRRGYTCVSKRLHVQLSEKYTRTAAVLRDSTCTSRIVAGTWSDLTHRSRRGPRCRSRGQTVRTGGGRGPSSSVGWSHRSPPPAHAMPRHATPRIATPRRTRENENKRLRVSTTGGTATYISTQHPHTNAHAWIDHMAPLNDLHPYVKTLPRAPRHPADSSLTIQLAERTSNRLKLLVATCRRGAPMDTPGTTFEKS